MWLLPSIFGRCDKMLQIQVFGRNIFLGDCVRGLMLTLSDSECGAEFSCRLKSKIFLNCYGLPSGIYERKQLIKNLKKSLK